MNNSDYNPLHYIQYQQDRMHRLSAGKRWREFAAQMDEMIRIAQTQAEAAQRQAALAEKKAKKADIKGIIALIVSLIALAIEFVVNYDEIIDFFMSI